MIKLFPSNATEYSTMGIGSLSEATSCPVTKVINGEYELELEYPITGKYYSEIKLRSIIVTKPDPYSKPQAFRIYDISKPINGIITVNAQHISYDLSGYPVSPFTATGVDNAFDKIRNSFVIPCPFTFQTNKNTTGNLAVVKPTSVRSLLGKDILDTYGGEYEFDNFVVKLYDQLGQNRGVSIRYGKNLMDLKQEENCASVYTGVYPFWYSEKEGLVEFSASKILNAPGSYDFVKIYTLDLSSKFSEKPSEEDILVEGLNYINENNIGVPKVSISVSFIQLAQTEEYKNYARLETVSLGDYINVGFPKLGVIAVAKCIKTVYNAITDKYENLELGEVQSNIATTIVDGRKVLDKKIDDASTRFDAEIGSVKLGIADIDDALIKKANIKDLEAGYAHLIEGFIDTAQIKKASIDDAMIGNVDAGKINAGKINTSKVDISSPDGRFIIKDNTQLIYDYINEDLLRPYLRVQLGRLYDIVDGDLVPRTGDNTYGLEIRDATGETVMIDGKGVHSEGITQGAVNNGHIAPNANIDGAKLDIGSTITSINNYSGSETISGSKIYMDDKTLDVKIQEVENNVVYKVEIFSTNGSVFKNGMISTKLIARVYHGVDDITDSIDANRFRWTRLSNDIDGDSNWNTAHFGGTKEVLITSADINVRATFNCEILQ